MALFIQLDVNYPDHPKVIEAGLDGAGLHTFAICVARRMEGDGWISRAILRRLGATDELIDRLIDLRLFEVDPEEMIRPWGYLDRNPSQGAIDAIRATKADAAKAGNHKRWDHEGPVDECRKCNPIPQVVAGCDSDRSQTESQCDPVGSPETESETETYIPHKSENHSDREPAPVAELRDQQHPPDEQTIRKTASLIGRHVAGTQAGIGNPAAYAAKVTRDILEAPDGLDRQRITRMLTDGQEPEAIAEAWGSDPFGLDLGSAPVGTGPDLKALYEAQAERTRQTFEEQRAAPRGDFRSGLAAARAASRHEATA